MAAVVSSKIASRDVVASGTLLFTEGDVVASVQIDDLEFVFTFLPFAGVAPSAERSFINDKTVGFTVSGQAPATAIWTFKEIARFNGRLLGVTLAVQHLSGLVDRPTAIRLEYNFTVGNQASAGWS